jgi:hypothetical protein
VFAQFGPDPAFSAARVEPVSDLDVDGEILAEEDAEPREATGPVRPLPSAAPEPALPVLRTEVRAAAIAAAGGVLAGAATVAAVRAVASTGPRSARRRMVRRRGRASKIVASRSFLVDVHLLGR